MTKTTTTPQRTEDQENAFRRIEDVHNYAKLQHHHHRHHQQQQQREHHNHHRHHHGFSSDELGEEEEEEDDDDEDDDDDDAEEEQENERKKVIAIVKRRQHQPVDDDEEDQSEVDVVTVTPSTTTAMPQPQQQKQQQQEQEQLLMRPEHHARRPMNAFLIFCKRHRAIVKERYKSLENRAITKILGDWWAALDDQEKQCFTDLAQQNKDAFFNANPNFKWYKLPAPPLRTLATRPSNAAHQSEEQLQQQQQHQQQQQQQQQLHWELRRNYFKFADETQMGELSVLLNVQDKDYALQQALSETSQFLNVHMPTNSKSSSANNNNNVNKRGADSASNSSEEEERGSPCKKLKSSRSCKGKIYQELINSGQLAAIAKSKSKCRLNSGSSSSGGSNTPPISPTAAVDSQQLQLQQQQQQQQQQEVTTSITRNTAAGMVTAGAEFDLEEKIKELPALSLDAYLQRKRSTKKKKKFSSSKKQRNSNSNSSANGTGAATASGNAAGTQTCNKSESEVMTSPSATSASSVTGAAVGSQKRKARKESITRRDVSAIEQEVASMLPLTINGCYYFNQAHARAAAGGAAAATATVAAAAVGTGINLAYDVTSTTSDLLILAEVAANRTELTKSN
ncbi:hypothetical protein KR093_004647 [Drosophila rubida]|uniref:HMG box domain-containing protein n=1 Tax=Drosophila rubida TaxID=30044 RepID=A0AAD4PRP4_9MUSC|nr:hypothetical protein KR093_004647 [Drosophila rubida]